MNDTVTDETLGELRAHYDRYLGPDYAGVSDANLMRNVAVAIAIRELQRLRPDARRYAWLRDQAWVFWELERTNSALEYHSTDGAFVDDAIDSAMARKKT